MTKREVAKLPLRSPRNWHGMTLGVWLRLLVDNQFAISPSRLPMALAITFFSVGNSIAGVTENLLYGRKARELDLQAPLFIVGHWRTGTTLLHELMVLDDRFNYPNTYQCMAPHHFLHTQWFASKALKFFLPKRRPMDNMAIGVDRPQEDEFALCNLGVPSPYLFWAFPDRECRDENYLDLTELTQKERDAWSEKFVWFLRRLSVNDSRQLVLKSPTHTARIRTLHELFPDAKFVHTVRNPYVVLPSTIRTWRSLSDVLGLQASIRGDLEEMLFRLQHRMYRDFVEQCSALGEHQFYELRYEDLVADPLRQVSKIYEQLELGDFEKVRPKLEQYFEQEKDYRPNRHQISAELRDQIQEHWGDYLERYQYDVPEGLVAE